MGLESGAKLGPYEIVSALGAGGMGEVYRARDTRLDRTVAIKVLNSALVASPDLKARFEREARTISRLNHPNICVLHDIGHEGDVDFLVMEFLDGESLAERIKNKGALPLAELIKIGCEIAEALDKAHRAGIVHRDLKPGNIMLTKTGAKLLDFGLAKPAAMGAAAGSGSAPLLSAAMTMTSPSPQHSPLTQQGALVGTVQYMSPEQIQGMEADARSDIFAFGAVLYEMATGKRAFEGKSQIKVASAILEDEPVLVSASRQATPAALDELIRACLAKNPDERLQAAQDVKLALRWMRDAAGPAPGASSLSVGAKALWMAMVLVTVLALTAAAWFALLAARPNLPLRAMIAPPDGSVFVENSQALSPDGTKWAFVAKNKDGKDLLWVRPLNSLTAQQLNGIDDAAFPFWSPDSRYIGFFSNGKLKRVDSSGGPAQTICDAPDGRGGSWNADGVIVFAPAGIGIGGGALFQVPANGGVPTPATKIDESRKEVSHRWPWFLPDGKHFLFENVSVRGENDRSIEVGSLDMRERHFVTYSDWNAQYSSGRLIYWRDGAIVAQPFNPRTSTLSGSPSPIAENVAVASTVRAAQFSVSDNGSLAYFAGGAFDGWAPYFTDATGKRVSDPFPAAMYLSPRVSPDAKRLAVTIAGGGPGKRDIWIIDIGRKTRSRLTFDGNSDLPVWSPDGEIIYYSSRRNGLAHIFARHADGSGGEETVLAVEGFNQLVRDISRDGRYLLFETRIKSQDKTEIWAMPLFGDRKPFAFLQDSFQNSMPAFSPDGKFVAYINNSTGIDEDYVTPFPAGGAKWQVTTGGGGYVRWRGDGKMLYFGFGGGISFADVTETGAAVSISTPKLLFQTFLGPTGLSPFALASQDGSRFFLNHNEVDTGTPRVEAIVLTNWPAELKK